MRDAIEIYQNGRLVAKLDSLHNWDVDMKSNLGGTSVITVTLDDKPIGMFTGEIGFIRVLEEG